MPSSSTTHCCVFARAYVLFALIVLSASGCKVGPDYVRPSTPVPDAWHQQIENGTYLDANGVRNWWTVFGDPMLDALIQHAKDNNLNLYAASQRICQARQRLNVAKSAGWPQIDATGSYQNQVPSPAVFPFRIPSVATTRFWQLGFDAAWEPDLWGRVQRDVEANCATFQSSVEAYRDSMVTLYSDVARNYVELRRSQAQLVYARQNVAIQKAALELADLRVEGGVAPILDSYQATANLASTEAEIPPIETAVQQSLNRLAVLLGEYPRSLHCDLLELSSIPQVPNELPVALPCDIVRQRPDIRRAERELAARTAEIGVATADLYPRLTITGSFNFSARQLADAFSGDAYNYRFGPGVTWPIFQAGRIKAGIASSECAVCEALATYEQTLLVAAEEVENAIVSFNKERDRFAALQRAVTAAEMSLESVLEIYRAGNTDFQNVLDTQRTLFTSQNQLATSRGQVVVNLVSFYKALGGGWDPIHHCQPRCVRVSCPPNCPVDSPQSPISEPSYLLDADDDMDLDEEADIEDGTNTDDDESDDENGSSDDDFGSDDDGPDDEPRKNTDLNNNGIDDDLEDEYDPPELDDSKTDTPKSDELDLSEPDADTEAGTERPFKSGFWQKFSWRDLASPLR